LPLKFLNMKRIFFFFFLLNSLFAKSQTILSDSVSGVNCYHDGAIFTEISSLDTSVFSKWYLYDNFTWEQIDTSNQSIIINNLNYNSDSLVTTICGQYKLEIVNILDTLIEVRFYNIECSLSVVLEKDIIICHNDKGSIQAIVNGGVPFDYDTAISGDEYYQFNWYSSIDNSGLNSTLLPDTLSTIDSLLPSYYNLIVSDAVGCLDTTEFIEIKNPDKLKAVNLVLTDANCYQSSTGSILFSASGGYQFDSLTPYFYYLISNSDTVCYSDTSGSSFNFQSLSINSILMTGLVASSYNLIVADSVNCLFDTTFVLNEPNPYQAYVSNDSLICSSDSSWIIIDSVSGGVLPIAYHWIASNNDSVYGNVGSYFCVINDSLYNCVDTIEFKVKSLYDVQVIFNISDVMCYGDSTGSIIIDTVYGGVYPYLSSWTGFTLDSLVSATYLVVIIDSLGCEYSDSIIVTQPSLLQANVTITHPTCYADSNANIIVNYFGGSFPYRLYWQNILSSDTIVNLFSGIYSYLIVDSNQCKFLDTIEIVNPNQISVDFINYSSSLGCFNDTTSIEAVVANYDSTYTVLWSNLDSTNVTGIQAGISVVTIIDNKGCKFSDSVLITQPDTFKLVDFLLVDATCSVGGSASVILKGGVLPYSYLWSTGETDSVISNIQDSVCGLIVTDFCGNSDTAYFTLPPFELITSLIYDDSTHTGTIEIDLTSTGGPFSYEWVDILGNIISTDSTTSNLCEGTYFVTTTDISSNCSIIDTLVATYYLPNGIVDVSTTTVFPDADLWGNFPYTYLWDNGEVLVHANVCSGSHWVEVTDNLGCVIRADFDIDPLLITLDPAETIIECSLENLDVELEAIASGGTAPYTYVWSNGSTENPLNVALNPGNYSVSVMDNNACTKDTAFVIATMSAECVPNVFTPNGDNVNDTWSLENTFLYQDSEIRVYGRFGKLMFQSVGYDTPWNGKNEKGNDVPDGVYFYSIEIGHEFVAIKGSVTILR